MADHPFPWTYQAYGLCLKSDIQIPVFLPNIRDHSCRVSADDQKEWIIIERDRNLSIAHEIPDTVVQEPIVVRVTEEGILLYLKDIALFRIQHGNRIRYHTIPQVKSDYLSLALSGVVMSALLFQRGYFIAHGSAVSISGESVLFLGDSGAGKSSLAIALHQRGYSILTDDLAGILVRDGIPYLLPAFPQVRVTQESAEALGLPWADLIQFPQLLKRGFRYEAEFIAQAIPLRHIYILKSSHNGGACYLPLPPHQQIMELMHHSEAMSLFIKEQAQHFRKCVALAKTVPIEVFQRPMHWATLSATLDAFERQLEAG